MYQNKVTLIGFLGSDAEVRSNDNRNFTTLSLAAVILPSGFAFEIPHTRCHSKTPARIQEFEQERNFCSVTGKGGHQTRSLLVDLILSLRGRFGVQLGVHRGLKLSPQ